MRRDLERSKDAASTINVLGAIVGMIESGLPTHTWQKSADRIIAICQQEQQRQLRIMDAADAKLGLQYPQRPQQQEESQP